MLKQKHLIKVFVLIVFLTVTRLGIAEPPGGGEGEQGQGRDRGQGEQGRGEGEGAESAAHQACLTSRTAAMSAITGFSSQKPWPIKRLNFAINNLKMMAAIPEEFLCHMKAEMSDKLSSIPVTVTKTMKPKGTGTGVTIAMTLAAASSDSTYDGKGYDYAASVTVNDNVVAKLAWAGTDTSTKGEATFTNLQSSMGVNDYAPRSETIVVIWNTKGDTADDVFGASKEIKVLYNRQFGNSFMGDQTGRGGLTDEVGYVERRVASSGAYYLKGVRHMGSFVDTVIANIGADGTGTIATSSQNNYVDKSKDFKKPSDMGLDVFNVNLNTDTATSASSTALDDRRFQLPPGATPKKLDQMGESGRTFGGGD
ncbi:MAG: hypothetical protein HY537_10700 [Deltaproteobacteria bacterium]|nr:hypothetical protein [Deltaproteobacteria bacterium]